jgi:hypothetical protein
MKPIPILSVVFITLALTACSTPDVALQQANHTSALMGDLEHELIAFRHVKMVSEQAQQESIDDQKAALGEAKRLSGPFIRSRKSAGDLAAVELTKMLIADADALAADDAEFAGQGKANHEAVAKLMTPLPSTSSAITKAQTKIALMGEELSTATRFGEMRSFTQAVRDNIDANRKKIEEAEAAAVKKD